MVKNYVWFNWLILAVFGLSTVLAIFIVYFHNGLAFAENFIYGYIVFILLYALYLGGSALKYWRKANRTEIKKRMLKFLSWFVVLAIISFFINNVLKQDNNGAYSYLFIPLGCSFGIVFLDVLFMKNKAK